jgi:hypothetical protein
LRTPQGRYLRYVPLLTAGVLVFLGVIFLGRLTGLLWHSRTFGWWVPLDPFVLGPTADWIVWAVCLLITIAPSIPRIFLKIGGLDTVEILTSFFFPFFSLLVISLSYYVGATMLVGSGFLAAYSLISRSEPLLNIDPSFALRLVLPEVFAFLAVAAAGSVAAIAVWQEGIFGALVARMDQTDPLVRMLAVDMETFYLVRPVLLTLFVALAVASIVALLREGFVSIVRWLTKLTKRLEREKGSFESGASPNATPQSRDRKAFRTWGPYVVIVASVILGILITTLGYTTGTAGRLLGSDMWFYDQRLRAMMGASDPLSVLEADRAFSILVLYVIAVSTQLGRFAILMLAPALYSAMLAVSTFVLVKEGTGHPWLAGFAALLSTVSAQTSLGMGAGILANWFSLSVANFMFTFVLRWVRLRSKPAATSALLISLFLLGSYAYAWVAAVAILVVVLVATIFSFGRKTRRLWLRELTGFGFMLVGVLALPLTLGYVVLVPLLGHVPSWFNSSVWVNVGSNYLLGQNLLKALSLAPSSLEAAFDFAGNRIDLPFLTILSIVGLADSPWRGPFRRVVAAMVLVPIVLAIVSPDLYLTWRGLYMIPMYLTGALGTESIIRRLNGLGMPWTSRSRIAFTGVFAAYIFLTHLSYSLRALELLILASMST